MNHELKIAVLGGGHAGFAHAADLTIKGFDVRLFEVPEMAETIGDIQAKGGIHCQPDPSTGLQGGFAEIATITCDAAEALNEVDVIFLVVPAFAQKKFAKLIAPHVQAEQIVVLSPANFGGAVTFRQALQEAGCSSLPVLCEAQSMIYACRKDGADTIRIFGYKHGLQAAVFPARETASVMPKLKRIIPTLEQADNVLYTWLSNPNAIGHPPVTVLNAGWIEQTNGGFLFYVEGMSPSVVQVMEDLDKERMALGEALGLKLIRHGDMARTWYGHQGYEGSTFPDKERNPVYASIKAESRLDSRYLTEDVPYGLVPLEDMGRLAGIEMPICTSLINLANSLLGHDFRASGQTLSAIGLGDLSVDELKHLVEEGSL